MERRLHEVATRGSVASLLELLQEDPLILDWVIVDCVVETPLHIAALLGHVDFAREILRLKPELSCELNSRRASPLHLASAKGYIEIVKELLLINPNVCFTCDRDGRIPLHLAAIKGRLEVLKELARARPETIRVLTNRQDTILHLCVKHNQLEQLKLLVDAINGDDDEFVNSKDNDGNTLLHLAVADKQIETINFLLSNTRTRVNSLNRSGFTALDVLEQNRRDARDMSIEQSLRSAGAVRTGDYSTLIGNNLRPDRTLVPPPPSSHKSGWDKHDGWLKKKRSALMVVASLIATMAFQAGVNPPGGVWQDNAPLGLNGTREHRAGLSIFADNYPTEFPLLLALNTTGFIASLSIIILLISGLPIKSKIFMWILMVIMWIAITSMAIAYLFSISAISPVNDDVNNVAEIAIRVWVGLMALLLLGHTIRLLWKSLSKLGGLVMKMMRQPSNLVNPNHV